MENKLSDPKVIYYEPYSILFKDFVKLFALLFSCMYIISFPVPTSYLPSPGTLTNSLFENLSAFTTKYVFGVTQDLSFQLLSDSTALYVHLFNLFILSGLVSLAFMQFPKMRKNQNLYFCLRTIITYYLAFQLLYYGLNKVFKYQFYLPEPNTLFTRMGDLHKDILYWSTMGSSYSFTLFSGLMEVIPGLLLLHYRTRLLGALISFGVLLQVLMINLSFDISVKVHATFLLLLSLLLLWHYRKTLLRLIYPENTQNTNYFRPQLKGKIKKYYTISKWLVVYLLIAESMMPYIENGNFNDDLQARPALHGAYSPLGNSEWIDGRTIKHAFVHRKAYLILEFENEQWEDYALKVDQRNKILILKQEGRGSTIRLSYKAVNSDLSILKIEALGDHHSLLELHRLDLKKMPLLQNEFNWTTDFGLKF